MSPEKLMEFNKELNTLKEKYEVDLVIVQQLQVKPRAVEEVVKAEEATPE